VFGVGSGRTAVAYTPLRFHDIDIHGVRGITAAVYHDY